MAFDENTISTLCPEVSSETIDVVRLIDVSGGARIHGPVRFSCPVKWVRETESRIIIRNSDGDQLHAGNECDDWFGLLTSPRSPLSSVASMVRDYGATPTGPIEVAVVTTVVDRPLLAHDHDTPIFADRRSYRRIPRDWRRDDEDKVRAYMASVRLDTGTGDLSLLPCPISTRLLADNFTLWTSRLAQKDEAIRLAPLHALVDIAGSGLGNEEMSSLLAQATLLAGKIREIEIPPLESPDRWSAHLLGTVETGQSSRWEAQADG